MARLTDMLRYLSILLFAIALQAQSTNQKPYRLISSDGKLLVSSGKILQHVTLWVDCPLDFGFGDYIFISQTGPMEDLIAHFKAIPITSCDGRGGETESPDIHYRTRSSYPDLRGRSAWIGDTAPTVPERQYYVNDTLFTRRYDLSSEKFDYTYEHDGEITDQHKHEFASGYIFVGSCSIVRPHPGLSKYRNVVITPAESAVAKTFSFGAWHSVSSGYTTTDDFDQFYLFNDNFAFLPSFAITGGQTVNDVDSGTDVNGKVWISTTLQWNYNTTDYDEPPGFIERVRVWFDATKEYY